MCCTHPTDCPCKVTMFYGYVLCDKICSSILIHISQGHHYCCRNNCRQIINCDGFQDDKTAMPVFCSTLIKEYRVHLLDESVIDYEF